MKKINLYFIISVIFAFSCKKEVNFEEYQVETKQVKIEITGFQINYMNFLSSAYSSSDGSTGPDIYIQFENLSGNKESSFNQTIQNLSSSQLPLMVHLNTPILITSNLIVPLAYLNSQVTIEDFQNFYEIYNLSGNFAPTPDAKIKLALLDYDNTSVSQQICNLNVNKYFIKEGTYFMIIHPSSYYGDAEIILEYKVTCL